MVSPLPPLYEDDDYVYVPEELFKLFPPEYRESIEAQKQRHSDILRVADADIKKLIRFMNAIPTTSSLSYIYHRLRNAKFEVTAEALMEQEMMTTAFIVTYSRLFVSGSGGSGVARDQIPAHLQSVHDDIIDIRNKRYAHNAEHGTVSSGICFDFIDDAIHVNLQMSLGFYVGGRNEWGELVQFLDAYMHERLQKILRRLKEKTGYEWKLPDGPAPSWVGSH